MSDFHKIDRKKFEEEKAKDTMKIEHNTVSLTEYGVKDGKHICYTCGYHKLRHSNVVCYSWEKGAFPRFPIKIDAEWMDIIQREGCDWYISIENMIIVFLQFVFNGFRPKNDRE